MAKKYAPFFKTKDTKNRWKRANKSDGKPYIAMSKANAQRTFQSWLMDGSQGEVWHNGVRIKVTQVELREVQEKNEIKNIFYLETVIRDLCQMASAIHEQIGANEQYSLLLCQIENLLKFLITNDTEYLDGFNYIYQNIVVTNLDGIKIISQNQEIDLSLHLKQRAESIRNQ